VLVVLVGALAIGAFIVLGVVAFVALGGILLVLAAVLAIRMWWLERKVMGKRKNDGVQDRFAHQSNTVIEGEYHVVSNERKENRSD
jgi:membrane protein implicated in regulation of membrane protease activity